MEPLSIIAAYHKAQAAATQHRRLLLSLLLTLLSCPFRFFNNDVPTSVDGSWVRALNMAVNSGRVFGRDFVFTYGPLGFLSTRNPEYVGSGWLLAGDILVFAGLFYFIYRHLLLQSSRWLLLLAAIIALRAADYSQVVFLLFIVYAAILLLSADDSPLVVFFAAIYGVLLFFVKVNYGLVSVAILAGLILYLALRQRKSAAILAAMAAVFFTIIYLCVHIDLAAYISNSVSLITTYDEAMYQTVDPTQLPFRSATLFCAIGVEAAGLFIILSYWKKQLTVSRVLVVAVLTLACFLFYRNGIVRYDLPHYTHFFAVAPMFFIAVFYLFGFKDSLLARIAITGILWLSFLNFAPINARFKWLTAGDVMQWIFPFGYYTQIAEPPVQMHYPPMVFHTHRNAAIGNATIDIFPNDISYIQINGHNYKPRPVPQSYTVYNGHLDSLNARFFAAPTRPDLVLIKHTGVDNRYYVWDESLTKATLHLNYTIADTFCSCTVVAKNDMFLYKARKGTGIMPAFEKIASYDARLGDTIQVPAEVHNRPLYMSADPAYTMTGFVRKLFYQPALCNITLVTEDRELLTYRLIRPIVQNPVIISRLIDNDTTLINFLSGNATRNKKITAFVINTPDPGMKDNYRVAFYSFRNY